MSVFCANDLSRELPYSLHQNHLTPLDRAGTQLIRADRPPDRRTNQPTSTRIFLLCFQLCFCWFSLRRQRCVQSGCFNSNQQRKQHSKTGSKTFFSYSLESVSQSSKQLERHADLFFFCCSCETRTKNENACFSGQSLDCLAQDAVTWHLSDCTFYCPVLVRLRKKRRKTKLCPNSILLCSTINHYHHHHRWVRVLQVFRLWKFS